MRWAYHQSRLLSHLGKLLASRRNIWDAIATRSEIKREYILTLYYRTERFIHALFRIYYFYLIFIHSYYYIVCINISIISLSNKFRYSRVYRFKKFNVKSDQLRIITRVMTAVSAGGTPKESVCEELQRFLVKYLRKEYWYIRCNGRACWCFDIVNLKFKIFFWWIL
jgi:hypothetical protein